MLLGVARCDSSTDRAIQTTALLSTTTVDGRIRGLPWWWGGEDCESKSFFEAGGKKAPRVAGCDYPARHSILFPINLSPDGGIRGLLLQG